MLTTIKTVIFKLVLDVEFVIYEHICCYHVTDDTARDMAAMPLVDPAYTRFQRQRPLQFSSSRERYIEDMVVVSERRILLSDWKNRSVLLVDSEKGEALASVSVPGRPWGVCMVHASCAAVTLSDKKQIQFVNMATDSLTTAEAVTVMGNVRGIATMDNLMAVTYLDPPALELVSKVGKRLHRVDNTSAGRELFMSPHYVVVSGARVFVSDWSTNTITMLGDHLQLLASFTEPHILKSPRGIISLDENQLLVCGYRSDNIVLLQVNRRHMSVILKEKDDVYDPRALAFCHDTRTVYMAPAPSPSYTTKSLQRYRQRQINGMLICHNYV